MIKVIKKSERKESTRVISTKVVRNSVKSAQIVKIVNGRSTTMHCKCVGPNTYINSLNERFII